MRRNEAGEDRLLGVTLRDLDDDRQDALHPRRMPGRVLGKQILHVDAEVDGTRPERTKAQRARLRHLLRHTGLTNAGRPRVPPHRWFNAVRPSRRPLRGLLRMRDFRYAIHNVPHAEERSAGARLEARKVSMQPQRKAPAVRERGLTARMQTKSPSPARERGF